MVEQEHTNSVQAMVVMVRIILIQITNIITNIFNISYILNIDLQCSFIMVKVLGELKALVIKGEDCLKKGQHLKKDHNKGRNR